MLRQEMGKAFKRQISQAFVVDQQLQDLGVEHRNKLEETTSEKILSHKQTRIAPRKEGHGYWNFITLSIDIKKKKEPSLPIRSFSSYVQRPPIKPPLATKESEKGRKEGKKTNTQPVMAE